MLKTLYLIENAFLIKRKRKEKENKKVHFLYKEMHFVTVNRKKTVINNFTISVLFGKQYKFFTSINGF